MEKNIDPIDMDKLMKEERERQERMNRAVTIRQGSRTDLFNMLQDLRHLGLIDIRE